MFPEGRIWGTGRRATSAVRRLLAHLISGFSGIPLQSGHAASRPK
jgi:hypothetical protein